VDARVSQDEAIPHLPERGLAFSLSSTHRHFQCTLPGSAGQTVPSREIVNARKRRREQLRTIPPTRRSADHEPPQSRWAPAGVTLPDEILAPDVIASLIRMSAGNFRLLSRLLTQIERILKVNDSTSVSKEIVAAARDSLAIGQA